MAIPTAHFQWSPEGRLQQLHVFDPDDAYVLKDRGLDEVDDYVFNTVPHTARAWLVDKHVNHEWRDVPTPPKPCPPKVGSDG